MGFSLGRALAGVIAGGAGAAAEIADMQIKEAAVARQREADFERQRELMLMQDEIMAAREQRVADTKATAEKARRDEVSKFMLQQTDALAEKGINPGSVAGQQALATAAARAGFQDYADKFYDNAIKISQIESIAEQKEAERAARIQTMQIAHAGARDRGTERADGKLSEIEKRAWKDIDAVVDGFKIEARDREGNKIETDTSGYTNAQLLVEDMRKRGDSPDQIRNNMLVFKSQFDEIRNDPKMKGARGSQLVDATASFISDHMKAQQEKGKPATAAPAPAAKPATAGPAPVAVKRPVTTQASTPAAKPASKSFFSHEGAGFKKDEPYVNKFVPSPAPDEPNFLDRISGGTGVGYNEVGRPGGVLNRTIP